MKSKIKWKKCPNILHPQSKSYIAMIQQHKKINTFNIDFFIKLMGFGFLNYINVLDFIRLVKTCHTLYNMTLPTTARFDVTYPPFIDENFKLFINHYGKNIRSLSICEIFQGMICLISRKCPNLESLTLQNIIFDCHCKKEINDKTIRNTELIAIIKNKHFKTLTFDSCVCYNGYDFGYIGNWYYLQEHEQIMNTLIKEYDSYDVKTIIKQPSYRSYCNYCDEYSDTPWDCEICCNFKPVCYDEKFYHNYVNLM